MNKSNRIIVILVILSVIFTIIGFTFAFYAWQTTEAQKTNITFTLTSDFSCSADGGEDITSNSINLVPTVVNNTTIGNYIKREVKVTPTINTDGKIVYMDLWLDVKTLGTGLSNTDYFKYSFTTGSSSPNDGVVYSGNFKHKTLNSKVKLLRDKEYTNTTNETYYLWIWLDAEETDSATMNQSFHLVLNGRCANEPLSYSEDILNGGYPRLDAGMIPIVFDTTNGTVIRTVSSTDSSWYSYVDKQWANAVLVKESGTHTRAYYKANPGVAIDESDILAYYVWIPRYSYKIWETDTSSQGKEQTIDIQFESTDTISTGTQIGKYITHPAFWLDNDGDGIRDSGEELIGIWIGKFETTGTAASPTILPDVTSLRSQNVSTQFATAQKLGGTIYGVSLSDSHMMKNSEWGAVAYLSHSNYGVNREVYINNSQSFYTGRSGGNVPGSTPINETYTDQTSTTRYNSYGYYTWDGYLLNYNTNTKSSTRDLTKVASTTGNITGIYDMAGGAREYVMGVFADSDGQLWSGSDTLSNSGFTGLIRSSGTSSTLYTGIAFPDSKYYDVYKASSGTTISALTACNGEVCYGHGLSETNKWYNDFANFVTATDYPWFNRGGNYRDGSNAGVFGSSASVGGGGSALGFRSVLSPIGA